MKDSVIIKCPWGDRDTYRGYWHKREWNGHKFLVLHCSVVAVKDEKAVTECVTVDGAIRRLTMLEEMAV
jgi:hypothetical protein|tara:strand:+ start:333 stop:539 length:207 start_codon:yes stop_codon:yes gene_type:complete